MYINAVPSVVPDLVTVPVAPDTLPVTVSPSVNVPDCDDTTNLSL